MISGAVRNVIQAMMLSICPPVVFGVVEKVLRVTTGDGRYPYV